MRSKKLCLSVCLLLLFACNKRQPILAPEKMEEILYDIMIADSYVEYDQKIIRDSVFQKAMYRELYEKHGVTKETYDSALVWYTENIELMLPIYDTVMSRLNRNIEENRKMRSDEGSTSPEGDSVVIWSGKQLLIGHPYSLNREFTLRVNMDIHFDVGDRFYLRYVHLPVDDSNSNHYLKSELGAVYTKANAQKNDSIYIENGFSTVALASDSAQAVNFVYGKFSIDADRGLNRIVMLDSIQLWRVHCKSKELSADSTSLAAPVDTVVTSN